jgi:hypothetical protein
MNDEHDLPPSLRRYGPELERALQHELEGDVAPAARRVLRARSRLLAGTTAGFAAIVAALTLLLSAAGTPPAFAVTQHRDGTYTVTVRSIGAIAAANNQLIRDNLRARIVQVTSGCQLTAVAATATPSMVKALTLARAAAARPQALVRLDPKRIPTNKVVVIAAWKSVHGLRIVRADTVGRVVGAPAPACVPPVPVCGMSPAHANGSSGATGNSRLVTSSGNSGSSGSSGSGNSGSSGSSGSGNSGSSGSSGSGKSGPALNWKSGATGNTGTSFSSNGAGVTSPAGAPVAALSTSVIRVRLMHLQKLLHGCIAYRVAVPVTGNSGSSGNSGPGKNSGNS